MSFVHLLDPLPIATAFAGCAFGFVYFALLKRTVVLLARERRRHAVMVLTLGRLGAAIVFFLLIARLDALALLTALGGFLAARAPALRSERRTG